MHDIASQLTFSMNNKRSIQAKKLQTAAGLITVNCIIFSITANLLSGYRTDLELL